MMKPSAIGHSYDRIAARWLGGHLADNGLKAHGLALGFGPGKGSALDLGCGCHPRFRDLLEAKGYEVEGVDLSVEMIALARQQRPHGIFYQADICEWMPGKCYDFITAWDSLWHVPLERAEAVLRKWLMALSPGGVMIWTTGGVEGPEEFQNEDMGVPVYYSAPGLPGTLRIILECGCRIRHLEYDQWPERHVVLVAQKS